MPFRIIAGRNGLFAVLAADTVIARAIEVTGGFAEGEVSLLRALVRPGDTVVDVGANIGTVSVPLARAIGPAGRLIAIEPQRATFMCLCASAVLNGLANIHPLQEAVGAEFGELPLPSLDLHRPANIGALSLVGATGQERVAVRPLDDLALTAVSLIKVDAEGMDWAVLAGGAQTISRCRPAVYVEANRDPVGRADTVRRLVQDGYRIFWHFARFVEPAFLSPGVEDPFPNVGDINMLALPKERSLPVPLAPCSGPDANWRDDLATWQAARAHAAR